MDRQTTTTNETEYEPSLMDMKYYCEMCVKSQRRMGNIWLIMGYSTF